MTPGSKKANNWLAGTAPEDRRCSYCSKTIIAGNGVPHPSNASIDHDMPKCRGGSLKTHNLVLSCAGCNDAKNDMTGDEYRHFLLTGEILPSYVAHIATKIRKRFERNNLARPVPLTPPPAKAVLRGGYWIER